MSLKQSQKSVLSVIFIVLFLITGRIFIWKPEDSGNLQQGNPQGDIAESLQTTTTSLTTTTVTTTTVTTTTTTTQFSSFYLVPPETDAASGTTTDTASTTSESTTVSTTETTTTTTVPVTSTTAEQTQPPQTNPPAPAGYFNDALFIGDSRMVGIASYSPIEGATYFATVGLAAYKIDTVTSEVPGTEGQTFEQVLNAKQYGKVYIMLGINELGMDFGVTMQNIDDLIARIRTASPDAKIILMANLHVSAGRHYSDNIVNNTRINEFNARLAAKADYQTIWYLDVNPVFDDAEGCLGKEYTSDNTHPYAKYYITWSEWLTHHTF